MTVRPIWIIASSCHDLPVILSPPLHHHQQVHSQPVRHIVCLKIVCRMGYVTFQFGRQEHPGFYVLIITSCHACHIHCRERERGFRGCLQFHLDQSARCNIPCLQLYRYTVRSLWLRNDEHKPFCHYPSCLVKQSDGVHSLRILFATELIGHHFVVSHKILICQYLTPVHPSHAIGLTHSFS